MGLKTSQAIQPVSSEAPVKGEAPFRRWEWVGISGLGLLWLWLRGVSVYHHGWNSDETQHLHVVWGWTQGLIPYRDFFDNHTPLFHLLFAPVFNAFGERADIIDRMRWCMVPLIALMLWCTYQLGAQAFSKRIGLVAALLCAFWRDHYFIVGEFRTDVLWTTFWMLSLVGLTRPGRTGQNEFWAGLALGAAFVTSQKTGMLALVLLAGTAGTFLITRFGRPHALDKEAPATRPWRPLGPWFWLGLCLVPAGLLGFFWAQGAWSQMIYCVVTFNLSTQTQMGHRPAWLDPNQGRFWLLVPMGLAAWLVWRRSFSGNRARRQVFLLLVGGSYYTVWFGLGTVITAQDFLPVYPILLVAVSAGLFGLGRQVPRRSPNHPWLAALLLVGCFGGEIGWLMKKVRFSDPQNRFKVEQLREVLSLTRPDEPVLDAKGGSVYRPRAIPYVMETLTRWRLQKGMLQNDVAERLVAGRAAIAIDLSWFPQITQDFVEHNCLYVGLVHVAGKAVHPEAAVDVPFRLEIPNRYVVIDARGLVPGSLDGGPPADRFDVATGEHSFRPARELSGPCYVLIERAYAVGFTPFNQELQRLERWRTVTD